MRVGEGTRTLEKRDVEAGGRGDGEVWGRVGVVDCVRADEGGHGWLGGRGEWAARPHLPLHDKCLSLSSILPSPEHSSPSLSLRKSVRDFLYGKPPAEQLQEWQRKVKKEQRQLDKEIREVSPPPLLLLFSSLSLSHIQPNTNLFLLRQLGVAQQKVRSEVKRLATKGDLKSARILAREVVRSNKQVDRLHTSKARLNSVGMQLTHQSGSLFYLFLSLFILHPHPSFNIIRWTFLLFF